MSVIWYYIFMNEPVKPEISYILPPEYQHFTSYKERADALGRISVWVTTDKGTLRRVGRKRFR